MTEATSSVRPLVLLVEDDAANRKATVELFEANGFSVITAESEIDAIRELRACPLVDMVIADVNLNQADANDCSGIQVAKRVRSVHPQMPLIAYSARVDEEDVKPTDRELFAELNLKGKLTLGEVERWRAKAVEYRLRRSKLAGEQLERFANKYAMSSHDVNLLREFIPSVVSSNNALSSTLIEDALRRAGYRLRIIDKGDWERRVMKHNIPVWIQELGDSVTAEVFGFPELYAAGDTEETALQDLVHLMEGYLQDLDTSEDQSMSVPLRRLKAYLVDVLG